MPSGVRRLIAVCGTSTADSAQRADAYRVGQLLAERGVTVLNGGLGGVMAACAEGVAAAGGTCIGLLPGFDGSDAAPAVTHALPTGLGEMRNALIVRAADGLIAIGGGWGTLSEIALAMRDRKPVVLLRSWELPPAPGTELELQPHTAATAAEAVAMLLRLLDPR